MDWLYVVGGLAAFVVIVCLYDISDTLHKIERHLARIATKDM
jgi:hypothetical protein